jgi:hypothetical protein
MKRHTLSYKVTVDTEKDAPITQEQIDLITLHLNERAHNMGNYDALKVADVRFSINMTADYDESGLTLKEAE